MRRLALALFLFALPSLATPGEPPTKMARPTPKVPSAARPGAAKGVIMGERQPSAVAKKGVIMGERQPSAKTAGVAKKGVIMGERQPFKRGVSRVQLPSSPAKKGVIMGEKQPKAQPVPR